MTAKLRAALAVAAAGLLLATTPASAQDPTEETTTTTSTTTTTAPNETTTTTSAPAPEETTTTPETTTTAPETPPATAPEPVDEGDHEAPGAPIPRGPWDDAPVGNVVLFGLSTTRAETAARLDVARSAVATATAELDAASSTLSALSDTEAAAAAQHQATASRFQRRVAAAYVVGAGPAVRFPTDVDVPAEADRIVLPGAVSEADRSLATKYRRERDHLSTEAATAADVVVAAQLKLDTAKAAVTEAESALAALDLQISATPQSIAGFVFPIAGPHNFISSFGFCRDGCSRSHQGNDLFAAHGTPVVAVEDGWVERIGTNTLGGQIVWTRGRSGYRYYYAHLSSWAPGLTAGQPITAGTLVGAVGNTGNAITTPPHLHFEIHPGNAKAIDPYPILRDAPVITLTTTTTTPPATVAGG